MGTGSDDTKHEKSGTDKTLLEAASQGRIDIVRNLLDEGADTEEIDDLGSTALHAAARKGHWDIARLLLERNASPIAKNGNDSTPLVVAVQNRHHQVARLLLECSAISSSYCNKQMDRPIHIAARNGDVEMVRLLLEFKVDTSQGCSLNLTALHLAAENGNREICEILLEYDKTLKIPLMLRMLGNKPEFKTKNLKDEIPFAVAIASGNMQIIETFFRSGTVSGDEMNGRKRPLFHDAVKSGNRELVRMYLDNGTDINMKGWDSNRAIHVAVKEKDVEMVRLLLEYGPSLKVKNGSLSTPEQESYNPEITMMLRNQDKTKNKGKSKGKEKDASPRVATSAPPPEYAP